MQSIEYNKENHPIPSQIYDILADFQKQITLCEIPAHVGVSGSNESDKAAKPVIDMPGVIATRIPYTDFYLTIRGLVTPNDKRNGKIVLAN